MNRPDATAEHLAEVAKNYNGNFYIWAASGTDDSAYRETLDQVEAMAKFDVFSTKTMTFHEKDGARHDYLLVMEYIYNALPVFSQPSKIHRL